MVNIEDGDGKKQLEVPLWFWNTDEWFGFIKSSLKTHRTTIVHALKSVRNGIVSRHFYHIVILHMND